MQSKRLVIGYKNPMMLIKQAETIEACMLQLIAPFQDFCDLEVQSKY